MLVSLFRCRQAFGHPSSVCTPPIDAKRVSDIGLFCISRSLSGIDWGWVATEVGEEPDGT